MACEQALRWMGGLLQLAGVLTVALTVSSVRRALGMDGIVAATVRRIKGVFSDQAYPGANRGGRRSSELRDQWPNLLEILPSWNFDDAPTLRREVSGHYDHLRRLQEELQRQRQVDKQQMARLLEEIETLDRHVVKVVGGGTRIEALGVVAFMLGIGLSTVVPELCGSTWW